MSAEWKGCNATSSAKSCSRHVRHCLLMSKGMSIQNLFVQLLHAFSDQFPPISSDTQNTRDVYGFPFSELLKYMGPEVVGF